MESLLSAMADSCVDFMFVGSRGGDFEGINEAVGVNEAHSVMMEVRVLRDIAMVKRGHPGFFSASLLLVSRLLITGRGRICAQKRCQLQATE